MIGFVVGSVLSEAFYHLFPILDMLRYLVPVSHCNHSFIAIWSPNINFAVSLILSMHDMSENFLTALGPPLGSLKRRPPYEFHEFILLSPSFFVIINTREKQSLIAHFGKQLSRHCRVAERVAVPPYFCLDSKFLSQESGACDDIKNEVFKGEACLVTSYPSSVHKL